MKKLMAILLALLIACLPMAVAEEASNQAAVAVLRNMNVMGYDLGALEVWFGIEAGDAPTFVISAQTDEETLLYGVGQIDGAQVKLTFDGEDKTYVQDLSELGGNIEQLSDMLNAMIPDLDKMVLPAIPGVPIPQIDFASLVSMFAPDESGAFEIPAETVDSLLDLVAGLAEQYAGQQPQLQQALDLLPQIKGKLAFTGTASQEGDANALRLNIVVEGEDQGALTLTSRDNELRLGLGAEDSELGGLTVTSNPDAATIDAALDMMGTSLGGLHVFQEDGLQKISLELSASGQAAGFDFSYGNADGTDIVAFNVDMGEEGGLQAAAHTVMGEAGVRSGDISVVGTASGQPIEYSADIEMYQAESLELGEIAWPETTASFDEFDADTTFAALQEYLGSVTSDEAA